MTQCYALSVLDNVNGFEPLTIELWERDILELGMGFVSLDTKLECNSRNCVQNAEYEDFKYCFCFKGFDCSTNWKIKKLRFYPYQGRLDIDKFSLHFLKLSSHVCIFRLKNFNDEIHILICKICCYQVFGMKRRRNRHLGQWNW